MGPMTVTNAIRPSDDNVEAAFARPAGRRPDAAGRPNHRHAVDGRFPAKSGKSDSGLTMSKDHAERLALLDGRMISES